MIVAQRLFRSASGGSMLNVMPPLQNVPPSADSNGSEPCPPTFEQALEQLERIVHQLEEGEIGLAEALDHYEKGIGLLKQCYGLLERAERRIELLSGVDAAGNPITEPFADDAGNTLEEKTQNRARRRTKTGGRAKSETLPSDALDCSPYEPETAESPQTRMDEPGSLF
jgi:exodeoxyribonuclease VII small subunit